MDPSNFDEFGNYIGPELSGSEEVIWPPVLFLLGLKPCYSQIKSIKYVGARPLSRLQLSFIQ